MRILMGLLLCLPVLAQDAEPEEGERILEVEVDTDAKGRVVKLDARGRALEIAKLLAAEADETKRAEMLKELVAALTREGDALVAVDALPLRLRAVGVNPFEAMNGAWDENGKKGSYTLKSLGEGRYRLDARIEKDGAVVETIEKVGTLADLRRAHPFLKSGALVLQLGPFGSAPENALGPLIDSDPRSATGTVGLFAEPVPEPLAHHLLLVAGEGLMVKAVVPGSRAERIGLRRYDVILRIGDERVESPAQLKRLNEEEGTVEIVRRGEKTKIDLGK